MGLCNTDDDGVWKVLSFNGQALVIPASYQNKCIICHGLEWYNIRELCERKFTTTAHGITLIPFSRTSEGD